MYTLHIANKNYSSWSMRPWVLMTELGIEFEEEIHVWGDTVSWDDYLKLTPTGLVPSLQVGDELIWDSLAIVEFLAERHPGVWPEDAQARNWSRCVSAEMHSGFSALRNICGMNCGLTIELNSIPEELTKDIKRIDALWQEGLERFGGPYLGGKLYSAVDAFYAPVVSRFKSYDIEVSNTSMAYMKHMLATQSLMRWYDEALNEPFREYHHEEEISQWGHVISDDRKA